jgi:beta-glucosidase
VAQLYVRDEEASLPRPVKELKGFVKVRLEAGERRRIELDVTPQALCFYDPERHDWILEPGYFEILVGPSAADMRLTARVEVL